MLNEEVELLKDVALRLEHANVPYMTTGSMAMAIYATPRMTRDIDIIIQATAEDVGTLVDLFKEDFYINEESVRLALLSRGIFNIIHNDSLIKVDLIVQKDDAYRHEEFSRRKKIEIGGMMISIVSPEDLVLSKLIRIKQTGSELQFRDVQNMLIALKNIDNLYLERWSKTLGVDDLLRKASEHE